MGWSMQNGLCWSSEWRFSTVNSDITFMNGSLPQTQFLEQSMHRSTAHNYVFCYGPCLSWAPPRLLTLFTHCLPNGHGSASQQRIFHFPQEAVSEWQLTRETSQLADGLLHKYHTHTHTCVYTHTHSQKCPVSWQCTRARFRRIRMEFWPSHLPAQSLQPSKVRRTMGRALNCESKLHLTSWLNENLFTHL